MDFHYTHRHASARLPVFARNVVATSHPLAAQAGLAMLQRGGNAVDAAMAAAAVMSFVEPCSNGLGSDAFCILWDGTRLHGLNASGGAPAAWTPEYFRRRHGEQPAPPRRGWDSVTVPGAVAAWAALSERFGRLPFPDLLARAIEIAERGSAVPVVIQRKWQLASQVHDLVSQPGFEQVFLPHGRAPRVGERFAMPGAARALRAIAETRGEAFYRGEIAQAIERHAREHGGAMTAADLAAYRPEWVEPLSVDYRNGYRLHEIPPNGQGIAALIALGIVRHFDLETLDPDGPECQHLLVEAMKLAFADAYRHVAEPASMQVSAAELLDDVYLAERARLDRPWPRAGVRAGQPGARRHHLPHRGRRARHDGELHPEQLHGLRLGRRRARVRREPAQPRPRLQPRGRQPERRGARQAAVPHHHSGVRHEGRRARDELRRDGRQHAAAGPPADPRAHGRPPPGSAGRVRRAALALQPGPVAERRIRTCRRPRSRA